MTTALISPNPAPVLWQKIQTYPKPELIRTLAQREIVDKLRKELVLGAAEEIPLKLFKRVTRNIATIISATSVLDLVIGFISVRSIFLSENRNNMEINSQDRKQALLVIRDSALLALKTEKSPKTWEFVEHLRRIPPELNTPESDLLQMACKSKDFKTAKNYEWSPLLSVIQTLQNSQKLQKSLMTDFSQTLKALFGELEYTFAQWVAILENVETVFSKRNLDSVNWLNHLIAQKPFENCAQILTFLNCFVYLITDEYKSMRFLLSYLRLVSTQTSARDYAVLIAILAEPKPSAYQEEFIKLLKEKLDIERLKPFIEELSSLKFDTSLKLYKTYRFFFLPNELSWDKELFRSLRLLKKDCTQMKDHLKDIPIEERRSVFMAERLLHREGYSSREDIFKLIADIEEESRIPVCQAIQKLKRHEQRGFSRNTLLKILKIIPSDYRELFTEILEKLAIDFSEVPNRNWLEKHHAENNIRRAAAPQLLGVVCQISESSERLAIQTFLQESELMPIYTHIFDFADILFPCSLENAAKIYETYGLLKNPFDQFFEESLVKAIQSIPSGQRIDVGNKVAQFKETKRRSFQELTMDELIKYLHGVKD